MADADVVDVVIASVVSFVEYFPCDICFRFDRVCKIFIAGSCIGMFSFFRSLFKASVKFECFISVAF